MTEVKPLVPVAGAAAFFMVRRPLAGWPRALVKEPIENQANRHF
jgi:hypothetical protein